MPIGIIVHAGAWDIPDDLVDDHRECCTRAASAGWDVLRSRGSALDAVECAIRVMEDHPAVDAGVGAFLNAAGAVELDAGLMDGRTLAVGSVAAVQGIRHPIALVRRVMASEHVLLVGQGAQQFADQHGVERCDPATLVVPRELARWHAISSAGDFVAREAFAGAHDTVGAVAMDASGNIAAGTSTGGSPHKLPGRVGDSPLVGSGYYADAALGGASCTGWGEAIMRVVLAKAAVDQLRGMDARQAAQWAVAHLRSKVDGPGGIIMVDSEGRLGYAHNTPRMAYAYVREGHTVPQVGI